MLKLWAANLVFRQLPLIRFFGLVATRVLLRRLSNWSVLRGALSLLLLLPSRLSSSCHSEDSATPVSQRLLSQVASCANSSSASLQQDPKLRTFWCASIVA